MLLTIANDANTVEYVPIFHSLVSFMSGWLLFRLMAAADYHSTVIDITY